MNFKSDNVAGVHPSIMAAISAANEGTAGSYGHDSFTEQLQERLVQVFEHDLKYYFACTGTACNCIALSAICPPYGSIYCSNEAHINCDECNAPGLFCAGAKLLPSTKEPSKIDLDFIKTNIAWANNNIPHCTKPGCVTITQTTELGQVYSLDEIKEIGQVAHQNGMKLHMDGARLANALAVLKCTPAEMTWKSGVDVLSLGATKNGGLMGELIIFFDKDLAPDADYIHKRAGQLFSKTRFFAAQMLAYFKDDLWIKLANNSNDMATKLVEAIKQFPKIELVIPAQANEIFVRMPRDYATRLWDKGAQFYDWDLSDNQYRWVTSWATTDQDIEKFVEIIKTFE